MRWTKAKPAHIIEFAETAAPEGPACGKQKSEIKNSTISGRQNMSKVPELFGSMVFNVSVM